MIKHLSEMSGNKEITLNIEPLDENADNYEQRVKRMEFYERNGFRDTGYHLLDVTGEYAILSTAYSFNVEDYKKAICKIGMKCTSLKLLRFRNRYKFQFSEANKNIIIK